MDGGGGGSGGATGGLSVNPGPPGGPGAGTFGYGFFQPRPLYGFSAHHHKIAQVSPHHETRHKHGGRTGDIGRGVGSRRR